MSEGCNHDCSSCGQNCADREPVDIKEKLNGRSSVKNVIAVVSGKGGVGKSLVTSMLATVMNRRGHKIAILDADITGPSIPKVFGLKDQATVDENVIIPAKTKMGIDVMSVNLLLQNETDPVVWRGPVIAGTVKQFWSDVLWEDVDYMFVDMPPGTGDVPLTVFQSLPVKAIIVVTSPQELVSMIVQKAVKMANMMDIPVLGLVENMSYFQCPDCGEKHNIFGNGNVDEIAESQGIQYVSKLPISPQIASLCDMGKLEDFEGDWLNNMADAIEKF
mgnify:CR=1 FL=1